MRTSQVAYVVIRLRVGERDCFLLQRHRKWGDWSLVGGHVEPFEQGDWFAAARREAEEELVPLHFGADFTLERIAGAPERWGPTESRSAGGAQTNYEAAWFALKFRRDPAACVRQLPAHEFRMIDRQAVLRSDRERPTSSLLRRLDEALPHGIATVPLAWPEPVPAGSLPAEILDESTAPNHRAFGAG